MRRIQTEVHTTLYILFSMRLQLKDPTRCNINTLISTINNAAWWAIWCWWKCFSSPPALCRRCSMTSCPWCEYRWSWENTSCLWAAGSSRRCRALRPSPGSPPSCWVYIQQWLYLQIMFHVNNKDDKSTDCNSHRLLCVMCVCVEQRVKSLAEIRLKCSVCVYMFLVNQIRIPHRDRMITPAV